MFRMSTLSKEYVDLILELDEVTKACEYNDLLYGKSLADIMLYQSQVLREFFRKSSMLVFCNVARDTNEPINVTAMNKVLKYVLDSYDEFATLLRRELMSVEAFVPSTDEEIRKTRECYREIGLMLHPKINDLSLSDADLAFIWAKTTDAYAKNDWKQLMFLKERAERTLREQGIDLSELEIEVDEKEVLHLRSEVNEIKASEDYLLGEKLRTKGWIAKERARLIKETKATQAFVRTMDESLQEALTSGIKMVLE